MSERARHRRRGHHDAHARRDQLRDIARSSPPRPRSRADILVPPPASSIISLSSSPMPEKLVQFLLKQPHITLATGTMGQPLGGFDVLTGIDLDQFNRLSGGFRFSGHRATMLGTSR